MALTEDEKSIIKTIPRVRSDNDPSRPEFPPENPQFPATPTYQIDVPGFSNVWLKDESVNPTGTHKDRMAWEIVCTYASFLHAKEANLIDDKLPQFSIITAGSAGIAIQSQLRKYKLPPLKALIDYRLDDSTVSVLESLGCEIYSVDLSDRPLGWRDVLRLTNNPGGIDISGCDAIDPTTRFFDWMSFEILNNSPDYCFIPFGTGNLYQNILNVVKQVLMSFTLDPRFSGSLDAIQRCTYIGATTNDPSSKAVRLYSPHLPHSNFSDHWFRVYRRAGFGHPDSGLHLLEEKFLDEAIELANSLDIPGEPSGLAGLAMLLQLRGQVDPDKKILLVNTGKTKTPEK